MSKTLAATTTLIGTIIGAGILGIPYVIMKSGFLPGLVLLILIAIIMIITLLYLGEIALRTKEHHHLTGYAELYLGKKGKLLMFIAFASGIYSAILAYLIGEGESLSYLFFNTGQYSLHLGIAFWLVLSAISYLGIKALENGEEIGVILILILVMSISIFALNKINPANLTYINLQNIFIPFGVVLFAFMGFASIPEVRRILKEKPSSLKKTIITAYITTLIIYALFTLVVLGFQGANTPQIATLSLGKPFILLGILTMFTSYIALTMAMIDTLKFDFQIPKNISWALTITIPLILLVLLETYKVADFTKVLGIGGVLAGGLTAILILFMVKSAKQKGKRKPEYQIPYSKILTAILITIFALGATLEIINLF